MRSTVPETSRSKRRPPRRSRRSRWAEPIRRPTSMLARIRPAMFSSPMSRHGRARRKRARYREPGRPSRGLRTRSSPSRPGRGRATCLRSIPGPRSRRVRGPTPAVSASFVTGTSTESALAGASASAGTARPATGLGLARKCPPAWASRDVERGAPGVKRRVETWVNPMGSFAVGGARDAWGVGVGWNGRPATGLCLARKVGRLGLRFDSDRTSRPAALKRPERNDGWQMNYAAVEGVDPPSSVR